VIEKSQTVLVTGAAGFIASHVAESLLRQGHRVVGVDNFCDFYPRAAKERNVSEVLRVGQMELVEADITDAPAMSRLIASAKPDAIIHLAAMAGVRPSIERPAHYARVNVEGTVNLLEAAVKNDVKKFIFASSSSVYGNNSDVPFSEADEVANPISPYAATKRAGELICHSYHHLYRLPITCLRFFTVFGPRQRPDLAIHKFVRLMHEGKSLPFFGDGSTSRDYTYIADIVLGIQAALDRCSGYHIYNLGGNDPVTLARLIEEIERATGIKAVLDRKPPQPGDVERTYADLTRSRAELGYFPTTSLRQGLENFVAWYRAK
jgi:UDP-glucuronate 4-epimerase